MANYLGQPAVTAAHMLDAIAILREEKGLEDLGRPVSPLVPRGGQRGVDPEVRDLVQRWWVELGEDMSAELDRVSVERLMEELGPHPPAPSPDSAGEGE